MKVIIIGLGYFGSSLALKLTYLGHDVMGIDRDISRVELLKDEISSAICLNASDQTALKSLPLEDAELVVVAIGEDFGSSVQALANLKILGLKRIVGRIISPVHKTVLEALGVSETIYPEKESAERFAIRLEIPGILFSHEISDGYSIMEALLPERYHGLSIKDSGFESRYNVKLISLKKCTIHKNFFGKEELKYSFISEVTPDMILQTKDILIVLGKTKNMIDFLD